MFRSVTPADKPALLALAAATGVFEPHEAETLLGKVLDDLYAGRLGPGHSAYVWIDKPLDDPSGWVYFSPDAHSNRAWQLWWIGVAPNRQQQGIGSKLIQFVEKWVQGAGGRLLLVGTSSLLRTRIFYTKQGYAECGCIPDFYADGNGKLIFAKSLPGAAD